MLATDVKKIMADHTRRDKERRDIHESANRALAASKRAIFKLHREDRKGAAADLKEARDLIRAVEKNAKRDPALLREGALKAALEEMCEAVFVYDFFSEGRVTARNLPTRDPEIVIGGLSDFLGELARQAVLRATEGDAKAVEHMFLAGREVVEELLQLDLTGSLRSKFDQARQHLRKLEDIRYDLSRRSG